MYTYKIFLFPDVIQIINKFLDQSMNLRPEFATTGPQKRALSLPVVRDLDWRFSALRDKKLPGKPRTNKLLAMIGQQRGLQIDGLQSKCDECQQERGVFSTCVVAKMPTDKGKTAQLIGSGGCMGCYFENKICSFSMLGSTSAFLIHDDLNIYRKQHNI